MKNFSIKVFVGAALIAAALTACSLKEDLTPDGGNLPGLTLRFTSGDSFNVKAVVDSAGIESLNENKLSTVEYFMYRQGHTNENAIVHGFLRNVVQLNPYSVPMTDDIVSALCPSNSDKYFVVYAIANHPRIVAEPVGNADEDLSGTSVPELEALTQAFYLDNGEVKTPQDNFLMSSGEVSVGPIKRRNTDVASATINLKRVAAKLSILVRVADSFTITNTVVINGVTDTRTEVWRPRKNEMSVYLVNGAATGQVGGMPLASPGFFSYEAHEFDYTHSETHRFSRFDYVESTDEFGQPILDDNNYPVYDYVETTENGEFFPCEIPFYTYPQRWQYGDEDEPYIKLVIPWDRDAGVSTGDVPYGPTSKQYYYRIYCPGSPVDGNHAEFLRNHWYKVILNVGILGSEVDGGESIINGQYYVVDWQERDTGSGGQDPTGVNDSDKETEIKGARYLFLNKTEYELFNINELSIPYITTNACEIVNVSAKKYFYSGSVKDSTTISTPATWNMTLQLVTSQTGAHIQFNHVLNNDTSGTDYDVSPYIITFRLRQKDAPDTYYKDITIYQYPAIMIDMDNNNGNVDNGYTYVNGGYRLGFVGNTNGTSSGNNTNFNMILIETTVLPPDSDFMLGDPRTSYIDNLYYPQSSNTYSENTDTWPNTTDAQRINTNNNWSQSAASVQGGANRRLSYYYPVDRSFAANNIIAPKFRVASSHGATNALNYASAFRRCASYQEAGYPAGRWRLPTVAEVTYAMKLNADGKIDRLFGSKTNGGTSEYWCNSGYISVYDGTDAASKQAPIAYPGVTKTSGNVYVRCVYDDWYWGDGKIADLRTFTWGDMTR